MKGFINRSMAVLGLAGGMALVGGCDSYRNLVDPCYPERYNFAARQEVIGAMAPQVYNGHVLDQTVWNYHFEAGTDKLTAGGMDHLAYLARRRPVPDANVYVQTAQDVVYDPGAPDKFSDARMVLDNKRVLAVQNFLGSVTAGRRLTFEVSVHDPSEVGIAAVAMGITIQKHYIGFQGNLPTSAGAGAANVAGGGAAAGGPAGAGR